MSFREWTPEKQSPAFNKSWIVEAKWAHPLWHSYLVMLYDLTTEIPGQPAPLIYRQGMTHEIAVVALNPDYPADPPTHHLKPANHIYQFLAHSDDAAVERVVALLEEIEAKTLSPDTDFRTMWDVRFSDGVTLYGKGGAA